jgi:DHA3 family multidrug efflux protein-like MFS transporter
VILLSSLSSLVLFALAGAVYAFSPVEAFDNPGSPQLWALITLTLFGAIAGNLRGIALSTLVTIMIPAEERDRANGLVGSANGVAFLVGSIFSGLAVGFLGVGGMFSAAVALTVLVVVHATTLAIPAYAGDHAEAHTQKVDIRGSIAAIAAVPGLFGLILFHTFNNFLGGVFMSLMDAYGLELVSVQTWGILWGLLSVGFIIGGLGVAKFGLGRNPLRTLLLTNVAMWTISLLFPIQASIVLLSVGMFAYLCLIPVVEAAEQTVLQKVVEPQRQGRVFGFAQSVEQAASPITAFVIGPIAQFVFIPFMTTGSGVQLIGPWFGTGPDRGMGLLFMAAAVIGLLVTLLAMRSHAYRALSAYYQDQPLVEEEESGGLLPVLEPEG